MLCVISMSTMSMSTASMSTRKKDGAAQEGRGCVAFRGRRKDETEEGEGILVAETTKTDQK